MGIRLAGGKAYYIQATASAFTSSVTIYYRFGDDGPFQEMTMLDDGSNFDEEANDKIYGSIIQPAPGSEKIQFYIRAENARSLNYFPARYMYELKEAKLADLN